MVIFICLMHLQLKDMINKWIKLYTNSILYQWVHFISELMEIGIYKINILLLLKSEIINHKK
jgi:hypothetical protein